MRDKTIIALLFCAVILLTIAATRLAPAAFKDLPESKAIKVINKETDDRGYISVQYTMGKDTFAYDYLLPEEYLEFLKTGNPFAKDGLDKDTYQIKNGEE